LRLLFESAGFRVGSASSFDAAIRLIQSDPPDILITDLKLGPYNGLHLALRSRVDHPQMGIIVVSNFMDSDLAAEAARQEAAFLVRPFGDLDLLNAVNRSLSSDSTPATAMKESVTH
jgi:DNA-binding NtrC family response regulator